MLYKHCPLPDATQGLDLLGKMAGFSLHAGVVANARKKYSLATGEVTTIGKLEPTTLSSNWEVSRYFLIHYVIKAESYDAQVAR